MNTTVWGTVVPITCSMCDLHFFLSTLYGEQCVARDTVWGTVLQDTLYGEQCWQEVWQTVVSVLDVVHVVVNVVIFFINVLANEVLELC